MTISSEAGDAMTATPACGEIVARLKVIPELIRKRPHGPREFIITEAERDALLALVEPKTCATCRHSFADGEMDYPDGWAACRVLDCSIQQPFSCSLHEPAPPSPRPSPSSETPEPRA